MDSIDENDVPRTIVNTGPLLGDDDEPGSYAHYLVTMVGHESGMLVEIREEPLTIGRDARHALAFTTDFELSRTHARVRLGESGVVAEDLGSTNGTFVDGNRLAGPVTLREGSVIRLGRQSLKYERRLRADVERVRDLDRDLLKAASYVHSLLPAPIERGPARTDWTFVPSAHLGGDAFGYDWLDETVFAFYLMDVAGHGVGAAMHSVAVMNVLRQRALPGVDFTRPDQVLRSLNDRFQMDAHEGLYFTMWYGVYRPKTRRLAYGAAGHHPAYLARPGGGRPVPLGQPDLMAGATPGVAYAADEAVLPPGSTLYLFSDGVFEIVTADGRQWGLPDFLPLLEQQRLDGVSEPARLLAAVRAAAREGPLDDDVTILLVEFP